MPEPYQMKETLSLSADGVTDPFSWGPSNVGISCTPTFTGGSVGVGSTVTLEATNDVDRSAAAGTTWSTVDSSTDDNSGVLNFGTTRYQRYRIRVASINADSVDFHLYRFRLT